MKRILLSVWILCVSLSILGQEELWCKRGEKRIYGMLYRPEKAEGKLPLVIISHGFGGTNQWGKPYAEALTQRGYMVYCFDFCGGGNYSKSDGKTTEMSVFSERDDLRAVLSQLRQRPDVDTQRITLMGESQGGIVTAITAVEVEPLIHDIILFYPAFSIPEDSKRRYPNPDELPEETEIWGVRLGRTYAEGFVGYNVYDVIAPFSKPVLIVHGDADRIVPLAYGERAAQIYKDATFHVLHGIDHGYQGIAQWLAIQLVVEFLEKQSQ